MIKINFQILCLWFEINACCTHTIRILFLTQKPSLGRVQSLTDFFTYFLIQKLKNWMRFWKKKKPELCGLVCVVNKIRVDVNVWLINLNYCLLTIQKFNGSIECIQCSAIENDCVIQNVIHILCIYTLCICTASIL